MTRRLARLLRRAADRIDPAGAPRSIGWSFRIVGGQGMVFLEDPVGNQPRQGCPLTYQTADYDLAFDWESLGL